MAFSFSKTLLIGHTGSVPQLQKTKNNLLVVVLNLYVSEKRYCKSQLDLIQVEERHRLVFFGQLAEVVVEHLKVKGVLIFIEGKNRNRNWITKSGEKHYITEVYVDNVVFLDKQKDLGMQKAEACLENIPLPEHETVNNY